LNVASAPPPASLRFVIARSGVRIVA